MDYHKRRDELIAQIAHLEELKTHPGWIAVMDALAGQIRARRNGVFSTRIRCLDDVFTVSDNLAETAGLQMPGLLLEQMLDDLKADLKAANEAIKGDEAE